jgi:hypothetical protein
VSLAIYTLIGVVFGWALRSLDLRIFGRSTHAGCPSRIKEGTIRKGGWNREYQITERPPALAPQRPRVGGYQPVARTPLDPARVVPPPSGSGVVWAPTSSPSAGTRRES